jgi:hypothetical protein
MYNDNSNPTVSDCEFRSNVAYGTEGGGMYNYASSPTVSECEFKTNSCNAGAGMYNSNGSDPNITTCTFTLNTAGEYGGGLGSVNSSPVLVGCVFYGNICGKDGGGMYSNISNLTVTSCAFIGNWAVAGTGRGGGLMISGGRATVTGCTFVGNSAPYTGGGISNYTTDPNESTFTNSLFSGNSAEYGAGIYNELCDPTFTNCTFAGNTAAIRGAGIDNGSSNATVTNCILWGNARSGVVDEPAQISNPDISTSTVTYCCIQGCATYCTDPNYPNNIGADPLFVDPNGPDGDPNTWDDNDYHLSGGSPCIDVGDPNRSYTGQTDLDGQSRVMGGHVDMGSDEYPGAPYWYSLDLTLKDAGQGGVDIDPNDPNWMPYVYPPGTDLTLTAMSAGSKSFKKWKIWDANDPNIITIDTNNPTTILMSADRQVKAIFKCGGGIEGALPLLAAFGLLAVFAFTRRRR